MKKSIMDAWGSWNNTKPLVDTRELKEQMFEVAENGKCDECNGSDCKKMGENE